ncbi:MAG TPA: IS701 family transposase, partial [Clostridiales bacterium UBA8153]|nr:IS701 family transposase [Clostridiales bacterium UBA8153]
MDETTARERLAAFLQPLLPLLGRSERHRWGAFYVHGLLHRPGRKTAAGMAEQHGGNEQALQQFLSQSPWDGMAVRQALAVRMVREAGSRAAWVLGETGFPKRGEHSVGVARQYCGILGKVVNCQIGLSLSYATDTGCFPLDFQLYLPESWARDAARRRRARIPADVKFQSKWQLGLEMIDRAGTWDVPVEVIVAGAGYGVPAQFRAALRERRLQYMVGISGEVGVWDQPPVGGVLACPGRGRPRTGARSVLPPEEALAVATRLPAGDWRELTWREGRQGPRRSRFAALRVEPAPGNDQGKAGEPVQWLLVEWPPGEPRPAGFWLSNLPEETPLRELVYWAKIRWWVEQNRRQLRDDIGLDYFEGRSWVGWHHHVTLAMVAFDFLV